MVRVGSPSTGEFLIPDMQFDDEENNLEGNLIWGSSLVWKRVLVGVILF